MAEPEVQAEDEAEQSRDDGLPGSKVYAENLPSDLTEELLHTVFETYGKIRDTHIFQKSHNMQKACFIVYDDPADAACCIEAMDLGYEMRPGEGMLKVRLANPGRKATPIFGTKARKESGGGKGSRRSDAARSGKGDRAAGSDRAGGKSNRGSGVGGERGVKRRRPANARGDKGDRGAGGGGGAGRARRE